MEEKKVLNWAAKKELKIIFKFKSNSNYDCIVPVSGGKDGSYVAYKIKKLGLNPITVTSNHH